VAQQIRQRRLAALKGQNGLVQVIQRNGDFHNLIGVGRRVNGDHPQGLTGFNRPCPAHRPMRKPEPDWPARPELGRTRV
jgi:hypothetical protein